jgi:hypothetical protein
MRPEVKHAIGEQVTTLGEQFDNAAAALATGDIGKLEKAISIIEKVARIVLVVIAAIGQVKGKK